MKAIVHGFAKPRANDSAYETENMFMVVDIPFIPTRGTAILLSPGGEYLTVAQVMWDIANPEQLEIFTEEPDPDDHLSLRPFKEMLEQGWRIGSGERFEEFVHVE